MKTQEPVTSGMNAAIRSRWGIFWILSLAICLSSAAILFSKIPRNDFFGDEAGWISAAYYYTDLVRHLDFDRPKWDSPALDTFGSINMHVGEWLIGIPLEVDPQTRTRRFLGFYEFRLPLQWNMAHGNVPPRDILLRARFAPALFGVLCCFLVFAIAYWTFSVWAGLIAAVLLMASSLFTTLASEAMTDVFYNFFLLAGCLALVAFSKAPSKTLSQTPSTSPSGTTYKRRALILVCICGVLAGLACSVKITGLAIAGVIFLAAMIQQYAFRAPRAQWKEFFLSVAAFSFCALITVYALNPYFWPSWHDFHAQALIQEVRALKSGGIVAGVSHPNGNYPQLANLAQPLQLPRLYFRWRSMMEHDKKPSEWQGNRFLTFHKNLFSYRMNLPGEFIFIGLGIFALLRKNPRTAPLGTAPPEAASPNDDRTRMIPLLYFAFNYLFILLFMIDNWPRYYLPTMIAGHLLAAVGLCAVFTHAFAGFRKVNQSNTLRANLVK
jgi:4-amino-4-deoxy-L-arabinose transferase-like glycosyltransferase